MKQYLHILLLVVGYQLLTINYQLSTAQDTQRFAERQIIGSARYVGMGGAMTAIGGDPSAVQANPAGLGLYRRSEISLTIDETIDRTQQLTSESTYQRSRFSAANVSAIWALGNPHKQRGMIYSNFMLSTNRLANFNREMVVQGKDMGMLETICKKTDGLAEMYLQNKPWNDTEIGWLSILGYETYLINPVGNEMWIPAVNLTEGSLTLSETGTYDQYTLSWAGNISNQWYVGVSVNIPTLNYLKNISLLETDRVHSAQLKSMYYATGVGVSGSVGIIYRPIQSLRVGASFQTPAMMALSVQTEGDMYSTVDGQNYELLTPSSGTVSTEILSPLRASMSVAGQMGNVGLIALQYDYAHTVDMEDVHTIHVGAEVQASRSLFINAGYVYESSLMKEEPMVGLDYNSIRTDIDYRYTISSQYASAGIGYRGNRVVAQVAYQYSWQTLHQYASEMQVLPFEVGTQTHRIAVTLAWRFRDRAEMAYDNAVNIQSNHTDLTQIRKFY